MAVGVAWFDREQWRQLCEVAVDRAKLDDTFEEWEANARRALVNPGAAGVKAEPFEVRIAELVQCATSAGSPLMAHPARSMFLSCSSAGVVMPNLSLNRTVSGGRPAAPAGTAG